MNATNAITTPNTTRVVMDIDRGKVRIGIDAPRDVPIYRQELLPPGGMAVMVTNAAAPNADAVPPVAKGM